MPDLNINYNDTYCKPTLKAYMYVKYLLITFIFVHLDLIILGALATTKELTFRIFLYAFMYGQYVS